MENASRAFLDAVRKSMYRIRSAIGVTTIDPKLLATAECLEIFRREGTNSGILALSKAGRRSAECMSAILIVSVKTTKAHRASAMRKQDIDSIGGLGPLRGPAKTGTGITVQLIKREANRPTAEPTLRCSANWGSTTPGSLRLTWRASVNSSHILRVWQD
jgi:hypothetical protein